MRDGISSYAFQCVGQGFPADEIAMGFSAYTAEKGGEGTYRYEYEEAELGNRLYSRSTS